MPDEFEAYINPKDLQEFHIAMDHLQPEKILEGEWGPFTRGIIADVKPYPPMLPNQKYVRTGHLGDSWEWNINSPLEAEVGNVAVYAGWVQGVEQAGIHEGRWTRLVDVAERALDEFIQKLGRKVDKIWTR